MADSTGTPAEPMSWKREFSSSRPPLRVASLFAGCGGADLGALGGFEFLGRFYERLNTTVVSASDIDTRAVDTYNLNFSHRSDVLDVHDLRLEPGTVDVVLGGFPCQSFSTVNPLKNPEDARGQLFLQMARVVGESKPKVFIAENVPGFMRLEGGRYLHRAIEIFSSLGYRTEFRLLNSADYGIPQLRKRVFIVGAREDLNATFTFPTETHSESGMLAPEWVPLEDVIESVTNFDPKYEFSRRAVEGVKRAKPNMKRALAQSLDRPSLTITSHLAKVSMNSRDPILLVDYETERYRRFTPREAARIQSFPESFFFAGSDSDAYRQIGNAIPPVLMWHLFRSVFSTLGLEPA